MAVSINEKLAKIPGNTADFIIFWVIETLDILTNELPHRMSILAVNVALIHQGELSLHLFACIFFNFGVAARLLLEKLVAWEGYDLEPMV